MFVDAPALIQRHTYPLSTALGVSILVEFRPGASEIAAEALQRAPGDQRAAFRESWEERHRVIAHRHQLPLQQPPAKRKTKCHIAGMCLCSCRGSWLHSLWKDIAAQLAKWCPPKSALRAALKHGELVVKLDSEGIDAVWLHAGWVNLSTWLCSLLPVYPSTNDVHRRTSSDLQALEAKRGSTWSLMWCILADLDLERAWSLTLWQLQGGRSQVLPRLQPWCLQAHRVRTPTATATTPAAPATGRRERKRRR